LNLILKKVIGLMNKQEIFERVFHHLWNQNKQSSIKEGDSELGSCMYRTDDGRMCAAGCLITDDNYNPDIERTTVSAPRVLRALVNSGVPRDLISFVGDLQQIHDSWEEYHPVSFRKHIVTEFMTIGLASGSDLDTDFIVEAVGNENSNVY